MKLKYIFIAPLVFLLLASCREKEGGIPAYIHIPAFTLHTSPNEGTASHSITDAWVIVGNDIIGVFELPVTIPVLNLDSQTVSVRAGIKDNGIANTRAVYPFYVAYNETMFLRPGHIDTIHPVVTYFPNQQFHILENFEGQTFTFEHNPAGFDSYSRTSDPEKVMPGSNQSLEIRLSPDSNFVEILNKEFLNTPRNQPVYLEMNFKTDWPLNVGYYVFGGPDIVQIRPIMVLNPTEEWRKIYINLSTEFGQWPADRRFKIFFGALVNQGGDQHANIYLDNIKIISP